MPTEDENTGASAEENPPAAPALDDDDDNDHDEDEEEDDETESAARQASERLNQAAMLTDIESEYATIRQERDALRTTASSQAEQIVRFQQTITELQSKLHARDEELSSANRVAEEVRGKFRTVEAENKVQRERMDRMESEADALREEISRLTESNSALKTKVTELETESNLSSSSAVPLRYELERVRKELDSISSHSQWLESELSSKNDQIVSLKTSHRSALLSVGAQLDKVSAERDDATAELTSMRRSRDELRSKVEKISSALRDSRKEAADAAHAAEEELRAERRLSELQKEQIARLEGRYDEVCAEMERMKKLAAQAAEESRAEMESVRKDMEEQCRLALEEQGKEWQKRTKQLEENLSDAERRQKEAEEGLLASPPSRRRRKRPHAVTARAGQGDSGMDAEAVGGQEPMSLTDLYQRLAETEDELHAERMDRKRAELYLRKVEAQIEAKTPILMRQRREYENAVQREEEAKARLDEALGEAEAAKTEVHQLSVESREMEREIRELRQENTDLASQVQALLRHRISGASTSSDGDDVVLVDSVEQLQSQNQRLLREHRRLTNEVSDLEQKLRTDPLHAKLEEAEADLTKLREERARQATLVAGIVQQRDLYRALLAKHDTKLISGGDESEDSSSTADAAALVIAAQQSTEKSTELEEKNRQLEDDLAKVRADLSSAINGKAALEERLARLDAHCSDLSSTVDRFQSQLSAANAATVRSDADATYHREKCTRLEEALQSTREEISRTNDAKNEMQRINTELQEALSRARADAARQEQERRQAEVKLRLTQAQVETAKAAESRLASEANSLRSELARQGSLLDSVQRIEASISAKAAEEQDRLKAEMEHQIQTLSSERAKHSSEIDKLQCKIDDLEAHVKELETKKDEASREKIKAAEDAFQAKSELRVVADRCSKLEKELSEAKTKLGEADAQMGDDENLLQTKLEAVTAELESVREELAKAKERVADYQNMAKASEKELADLTKASEEYKKKQEAEVERLRKSLETSKQFAEARQEALDELSRALSSHRDEQEKIVSALNAKVSSLTEELETSKKDASAFRAQVESLTSEIKSYRADATSAQNNYERELALHAAARTDLRNARSEKETEARLRETAEAQLDAIKVEMMGERKNWEEAKSQLEANRREAEKRLEEARNQNKVLHDQMATLTETVERYRSEKIEALTGSRDENTAAGDARTEARETETTSAAAEQTEELDSLRKTVTELREIVRFMRSERDMIEAQLDATRRAVERERAASQITKRSLDEARAELQILQNREGTAEEDRDEEPTGARDTKNAFEARLREAESQLTLLRESNKLLREESEKTGKALSIAQKELEDARKSVEPLEAKTRDLEVDKTALESEKSSLTREVEAWKARVQSLVSKFHQIDPEEHAQALKRATDAEKECETLKAQKDIVEKENASAKVLVARLNKEISQQKAAAETARKTLAKVTSEKETLAKSSSLASDTVVKERDQLKEAAKDAEKELESTKVELDGARSRVEHLKKILMRQKGVIEQMKQDQEQVKLDHQKALESEKEAQKNLSEELKEKQTALDQAKKQVEAASQQFGKSIPDTSATAPPSESKYTQTVATHVSGITTKSAEEPVESLGTEKVKEVIPQVPPGGFTFAPSPTESMSNLDLKASDVTEIGSLKENQNFESGSAAQRSAAAPLPKSDSSSVPSARAENLGQITRATSNETVTSLAEKESDLPAETTPKDEETSLRAKLMKRKRELAAVINKPEEDKSIPAAKRAASSSPVPQRETIEEDKSDIMAKRAGYSSPFPPMKSPEQSEDTKLPALTGSVSGSVSKDTSDRPSEDAVGPRVDSAPVGGESKAVASTGTESSSSEDKTADNSSAPTAAASFGAITRRAAAASSGPFSGADFAFGSSKPAGTMTQFPIFGTSSNVLKKPPEAAGFGTKPVTSSSKPVFDGGTFLNLAPPGSSSQPLTFGSSATIKLPMPSSSPPAAPPFGVFGQAPAPISAHPFGTGVVQTKPLFESAKKRPSPSDEEGSSKQPRSEASVDTKEVKTKVAGENDAAVAEEGEAQE